MNAEQSAVKILSAESALLQKMGKESTKSSKTLLAIVREVLNETRKVHWSKPPKEITGEHLLAGMLRTRNWKSYR